MASPILPACSNCRACSRSDCTSPPKTPMSTMSFKGAAVRVRSHRFCFGIRGCVPIQAHFGELAADGPQVPDMHGRWVVGGHHQARPVEAQCHKCHAAQVGAFESRERASCLGLDQAEDPARILATTRRPSCEKQQPSPPICRASRQVPTVQSRHGECPVKSHFPSGLKVTPVP